MLPLSRRAVSLAYAEENVAMTVEPVADVKLGTVIYGRVSGYPWWPGVIAKCPRTQQWRKDGKFWAFFFNDTAGAWLKVAEIRTFDAYSQDLCFEYNGSITKFRRYEDRIKKAVAIADAHLNHSSRKLRVKVLPPKPENAPSTPESGERGLAVERDGFNMIPKPPAKRQGRKRGRPRKSRAPVIETEIRQQAYTEDNQITDEEEDTGYGDGNEQGEVRPKRKRTKSLRYVEYMGPIRNKTNERIRSSRDPSPRNWSIEDPAANLNIHKTDEDVVGGRREESVGTSTPGREMLRRSRRTRSTVAMLDSHASLPMKQKCETRALHAEAVNEIRNSLPVPDETPPHSVVEAVQPSGREKILEDQALIGNVARRTRLQRGRRKRGASEERSSIEEHIPEEELSDGSNANQVSREASAIPNNRRGIRARLGRGSDVNGDRSGTEEGTDSEEHPEIQRKVATGSLEVAAEDLMEFAINGHRPKKSESSQPEASFEGIRSFPLAGSDLVCSILNRISRVERDVAKLQKKAVAEEHATLGEDATAAGVKSAVEALAAASEAFARARQYDGTVIMRSLELLWSDGHFPLPGADGELLRTVAQSLILASCKRRRNSIESSSHASDPGGEEEENGFEQDDDQEDVAAHEGEKTLTSVENLDEGE